MITKEITEEQIIEWCDKIVYEVKSIQKNSVLHIQGVFPILSGGYYPATIIAEMLGVKMLSNVVPGALVIQDVIDSGKTIEPYNSDPSIYTATLIDKNLLPNGMVTSEPVSARADFIGAFARKDELIKFPWNKEQSTSSAESLITEQFKYIGEDPYRTGLLETPRRIVKMWKEIYRGYDEAQKPKITVFPNGEDGVKYDEMVVDTGDFISRCEHHGEIFFGDYVFGYIPHPDGKILGLSKVARVVDYYSARLQIQERLVNDIVTELWNALRDDTGHYPLGMGLVMEGMHMCKVSRGAKKKGKMITSRLLGNFKEESRVRDEFMNFVNRSLQKSSW